MFRVFGWFGVFCLWCSLAWAADEGRLVATYRLGPADLAQLSSTTVWVSNDQLLARSHVPYTQVISVSGQALNDGFLSIAALAGWKVSPTEIKSFELKGLAVTSAKAGEAVSLSSTTTIHVKDDKPIWTTYTTQKAHNMRIDEVRIEVWENRKADGGFSLGYYLVRFFGGLVFLGLLWWVKRTWFSD